jgi:hypothetical protein
MAKSRSPLAGAVALSVGMALISLDLAHAQLGTGSEADQPEKGLAQLSAPRAFPALTLIYSVPGIRDSGAIAATGAATIILCTNWTGASQQIRFVLRDYQGNIRANVTSPMNALYTFTAGTHNTNAFVEDQVLAPGTPINPGSLRIFATTPQVSCTAMVIDAAPAVPDGIDLHVVRHNVWPNTQE